MAKIVLLIISIASILIFVPRFYLRIGQSSDNDDIRSIVASSFVYEEQPMQMNNAHYRHRNQQQEQRQNTIDDNLWQQHNDRRESNRILPERTLSKNNRQYDTVDGDDNDDDGEKNDHHASAERQNFNDFKSAIEQSRLASIPPESVEHNCRLPKLDPWDESILPFLDKDEDRLKHCKSKVIELSELVDGELRLSESALRDGTKCFFRCLHPKDDVSIRIGAWISVDDERRPMCDIVEVECR